VKNSLSSDPKKAAFILNRPFVMLFISTAGLSVLNISIGRIMMKIINTAYRHPFKHLSEAFLGSPNLWLSNREC
jgi:hypothetical protein